MPISYSKEEKAWSLREITQEEADILVEIGRASLLSMMGMGIIQRMHREAEEKTILNQIPQEQMGTA